MDFDEALRRALRIRERYDELNLRERGRTWTTEEYMLGHSLQPGAGARVGRPGHPRVGAPA